MSPSLEENRLSPEAGRGAGVIERQIGLPWSKAIRIALNSLKIRFWRSMVTGAGIFLGIAFLCYSGTTYLLQHMPTDPSLRHDYEMEHNRQLWLVAMALLVCTVGIMNSMLMSVSERFREIGTMKCLGALDSLIVRLFLIEAIFMGVVSSLGGWLLGFVAVFLVHISTGGHGAIHDFTFRLIGTVFFASIVIGATVTLIAALLPANHASRLPAAAALRTEV